MRSRLHTRSIVVWTAYRAGAIVVGVLLAFGGLELGLRAAAFFLRSPHSRIEGSGPDDEIRIVCIGESTTAGPWPRFLEKMLTLRRPDLHFRVINRGVVGIRTGEVLDRLPEWIEAGRFQIAITMLGINDEGNVLVYPRSNILSNIVKHSKAVELVTLLWRTAWGIGAPSQTIAPPPNLNAQWDRATREAIERIHAARREALDSFHLSALFDIQAELLEIDPSSPVYHIGFMTDVLTDPEPPDRMSEFFRNEMGLDASAKAAVERYRAIRDWGRNRHPFDTFRLLTSQQRLSHDFAAEEQSYLEAIQDPEIAGQALVRYAAFLIDRGRPADARVMLDEARKKLPEDYAWSLTLAQICFRYGFFEDARLLYSRALEARPDLPVRHLETITGWLARACASAGREEEARELIERNDRLSLELFREYTRYNYSQIVDFLRARDITVIAMQYPTLSIEALQHVLDGRKDVIYLENRDNFEQAFETLPYQAIFSDSFAGSFGHCTPAGNELIAANVASLILDLLDSPAKDEAGPAAQSGSP